MKNTTLKIKTLFVMIVAMLSIQNIYAQPKSIQYEKEYDFFMNVVRNPTYRIYDFLVFGLNSRNAQLLDYVKYYNSNKVKNICQELNIDIYNTYKKIKAAWNILLEVENTNLDEFGKYMFEYNKDDIFAPRNCPNPELKHKLSIVPLKLENY